MTLQKASHFAATLLFVAALAVRGYSQNDCPIPQSPRNIDPKPFPGVYNGTPPSRPDSWVTGIVGAATIQYQGQTLYRCDQHYHVPVENTQGCPGEKDGTLPPKGEVPPPEQWIEVHTVYAATRPVVTPECPYPDKLDHSGLGCCQKAPFVVRGFSAKVTSGGSIVPPGTPIIPPVGRPLAEWTGSNTGDGQECKLIKAQWSSLLNCEIKVTQSQLRVYPYAHEARDVQPDNRLSKDLTLVGEPPAAASCREVKAPLIGNNADAKAICNKVCVSPAKWEGQWVTTTEANRNKASQCGCCVLLNKTPGRPE